MITSILFVLQIFGSVLAIAGAPLVGSKYPRRRAIGFLTWIIGNIAFIIVFIASGLWFLVATYIWFTICAFTGVRASLKCKETWDK